MLDDLFANSPIDPQKIALEGFIYWYLSHPCTPETLRSSFEDSLRRFDEWVQGQSGSCYERLDRTARQGVLAQAVQRPWGASMVQTIVELGIVAFLGDPIYGINPHSIGWHYVRFEPGVPRPKEPFDACV